MLLISEDQVKTIMPMKKALPVIRQAFRDFSEGLVEVPPRITMRFEKNNTCIFLPASFKSAPYFGVKYASSFPENRAKGKDTVISQVHLYSSETGEPLAVISANYLTAVKTGAAAGVATDLLANKDACRLAVIGTGTQAATQVLALQEVRPLQEVIVFDKDQQKAEQFMAYVEGNKNRHYRVTIGENADQCVRAGEIVSTCTPSATPVFSGDNLLPGTHLNAIGSFTPYMQEIDAATVLRADKIVTDYAAETWSVAGDLLAPLNQGKISKDKLYGELGDIVSGKIPGRENDREITLYESVGFSVLDIAAAIAVYQAALG